MPGAAGGADTAEGPVAVVALAQRAARGWGAVLFTLAAVPPLLVLKENSHKNVLKKKQLSTLCEKD